MIDFNRLMTEELEERRKGNIFHLKSDLPLKVERVLSESPLPPVGSSPANPYHITIDEETDLNAEF
ncbi:MAG: hypothetical protein V3T23_09850, partial [Nitrososphaerales archaeon]